jgi:hypothetical protein
MWGRAWRHNLTRKGGGRSSLAFKGKATGTHEEDLGRPGASGQGEGEGAAHAQAREGVSR